MGQLVRFRVPPGGGNRHSEGPEPSSIGAPGGSVSMSIPERLTQYQLKAGRTSSIQLTHSA